MSRRNHPWIAPGNAFEAGEIRYGKTGGTAPAKRHTVFPDRLERSRSSKRDGKNPLRPARNPGRDRFPAPRTQRRNGGRKAGRRDRLGAVRKAGIPLPEARRRRELPRCEEASPGVSRVAPRKIRRKHPRREPQRIHRHGLRRRDKDVDGALGEDQCYRRNSNVRHEKADVGIRPLAVGFTPLRRDGKSCPRRLSG